MSTKFIKANVIFNKIGKFFLRIYFNYKYNISADNIILKDIKPPYLILPNHTNILDPFFISVFVKESIYFVTSDEQFRYPIKRFLLTNLVGAIPKKKFVPDIITVKDIIRIVKNKGIVGIFPEGQRNWDGETLEIITSTAKLIKMLEIPVVTVILGGAYLAHPRWADKNRKGKVHLKFNYTFSPEKIKNMTVEEINKELAIALDYNEYEQQEKLMNTYTNSNLAEDLELFLFTCPHCKSIGTMQSKKDIFKCNNCNYSVVYNKYGFFEKNDSDLYFRLQGPWDKWQMDNLTNLIKKGEDKEKIILKDEKVTVYVSGRAKPLRKIYYGNIVLNHTNFYIENSDNQIIFFEVDKMSGINVQYNNHFEFYYNDQLFRFIFDINTISAYKWVSALSIYQILLSEKEAQVN